MLISRRSALVSATVLAGAALAACATDKTSSEKGTAGSTGSTGLTIVATTGYLGDAARNIAPDATVSPDNWKYVVTACAEKIAQIDPDNAATYKANGEAYNAKIDQAKAEAQTKFDTIPQERRVLVTGHDAFNYLGKTYNIEIHATDFVSSESEISATQIEELATLIADKKVPTIFQDNLKNPEAINHLKEAVVAKGWSVEVSDKPLYADSLGEQAPVDTYLGVFAYNADTIVAALATK